MKLHLDIETYSSVDITTSGAYKYCESVDFEILMLAYAYGNAPVEIIDLTKEVIPFGLKQQLLDPNIEKWAHNANFERTALKAYGIDVPIDQWYCSAVKAGYCGLPLSLGEVSKALKLGADKAKSATGKALIKYFSCPVKPTKVNGMRERNFHHHNPEKWQEFKDYCVLDVEAEREVSRLLSKYEIPESERLNYILDQEINDRGILVDLVMAQNAYDIDNRFSAELYERVKNLTGLDNPNSPAQLKKWLQDKTGLEIPSLAKGILPDLTKDANCPEVAEVIGLRQMMSKTSTKKYLAMLNCACEDNRAHGLFQFYGANRTGRWAGRLIQMQNLPKPQFKTTPELDLARETVRGGDYEAVTMLYDNISSLLSQLIRPTMIAKKGHTFGIMDFSAIEAVVVSYLANEKWRLDVFNTHGKIYESAAALMFNLPLESVTKDSDYRAKGKVAELALSYQGAVGAMKTMGGEAMGLSEQEMQTIVEKWRRANPAIVSLWSDLEQCAMRAIQTRKKVTSKNWGLEFDCDEMALTIKLPSGRKLFYQKPSFTENRWGKKSIRYQGMDQITKQWAYVDTYGGKLTENCVQAIARDLLAEAMLRLDSDSFEIVAHVHDEVIAEIPLGDSDERLKKMKSLMCIAPKWAPGFPLRASGENSLYYTK